MKVKIISLPEALDLADKFPEWVSELLQESASGARDTIQWFIKTLYREGYKIAEKK